MQDNFNFKSWIMENRTGPYSKDTADYGKKQINEGAGWSAKRAGMSSTAEEMLSLFKQDIAPSAPTSKVGLKGDKIVVRAGSPEEAQDVDMIARTNYKGMLKKVETGNPTDLVYTVAGYQLPGVTEDDTVEEAMDLTPPSPENIYEPDYGTDQQERFLGLGGDRVISGIESLMDDGFDLEDIIDIIRQHFQGMSEASHDLTEQPKGETYYSVPSAVTALEDAGGNEDVIEALLSIEPTYQIGDDDYLRYVKGSEIEAELGTHAKEFLDNVAREYGNLNVSEKSLVRKGGQRIG